MDSDKSIFEKITDTVKDIANIAADAASHALQAEEPAAMIPPKPRRKTRRAAPKPGAAAKKASNKVRTASRSKRG
jgi:hypothetical protein